MQILLRRRRTLLVAGLAALIFAAAVPAAIAARSHPAAPEPAAPHALPSKMTGLPMPAGTNLQLLDEAGQWYSTGSQTAAPIAGLPAEPFAFTRVPGGWAVTLLLAGWACPPHCWNGQFFVADGSTHATRIGTGLELVAAGRPGEVWLLSYARTMVSTAKASASVQLYSTTGHALGLHYRLPAGYLLVRAIGRYLLLTGGAPRNTSNSNVHVPDVLWDPRSRRVVDRFPSVIDNSPDEIAWIPPCHGCNVMLLNVLSGKTVRTLIPGGPSVGLSGSGSFCDDGTLLAVQLPSQKLAVYSTSSRSLTVIPGTALNFSSWESFGWLNGSHTLVVTAGPGRDFSTGPEGPDQLAYWQPGDTQLRIATVTDQGEIGALQGWAS